MSTDYDIFKDKELFEYLGRALYECQRLEVSFAHIIQDLHLLAGRIQGNDLLERLQEFRKVLASKRKKPLGFLFKELRNFIPFDDTCERLLDDALEKRNNIVHHFFYNHWVAMITPAAHDVMLDDLKEGIKIICAAYDLSENIHKHLDARMKSDTETC